MSFHLSRSISSSYSHLAIILVIMTVMLTIVRGVLHDVFREEYAIYLGPAILPFAILFFVFMVRLIKNLGVNERLVNLILALLVSAVLLRITTVVLVGDVQTKFILTTASSSLLLIIQSICVFFMCSNLFIETNPIREKLWASVCVYFMIAATFGTVYSILITVAPGSLGMELHRPIDIYVMGLVYSFNVISGLDPVYEHASETIKMAAVLESIFTMLFMVILIGRLLGSKD